ncbi:MAG: PTS sugar transporter subunit IIC [Candidatus Firestonebacteria bacterium]
MFVEILLISILAGIIAIDVRTIGGTMLSRPLVVGPLVGLILGDIGIGFYVAILVELLWIGILPIGAYLLVETLPITTVTVSLTVILKDTVDIPVTSLLIFALMAAIPLGYVGRWSEAHIRNLNSTMSASLIKNADQGDFSRIAMIQGANIFITFLKNFVLCFVPIFFGCKLFHNIVSSMPSQFKEGVLYAHWLIPALGFSVIMEIFLVAKHVKVFFASYILSIALFYAIKVIR